MGMLLVIDSASAYGGRESTIMQQGLCCRLRGLDVAVQRRPGDMKGFANITRGICLVSIELFGHGDFS